MSKKEQTYVYLLFIAFVLGFVMALATNKPIIVEVPLEITDFEEIETLELFLQEDNTDELYQEYNLSQGLEAFLLEARAASQGHRIQVTRDTQTGIIMNRVVVGGYVYYIEPRTDEVLTR